MARDYTDGLAKTLGHKLGDIFVPKTALLLLNATTCSNQKERLDGLCHRWGALTNSRHLTRKDAEKMGAQLTAITSTLFESLRDTSYALNDALKTDAQQGLLKTAGISNNALHDCLASPIYAELLNLQNRRENSRSYLIGIHDNAPIQIITLSDFFYVKRDLERDIAALEKEVGIKPPSMFLR